MITEPNYEMTVVENGHTQACISKPDDNWLNGKPLIKQMGKLKRNVLFIKFHRDLSLNIIINTFKKADLEVFI